jgi:hypothetical protein
MDDWSFTSAKKPRLRRSNVGRAWPIRRREYGLARRHGQDGRDPFRMNGIQTSLRRRFRSGIRVQRLAVPAGKGVPEAAPGRRAGVESDGRKVQGHYPFYTIGHSTRSVADLAALLGEARADLLADVRTIPRSRANPQFNADTLPDALAPWSIGYRRLPKLGGLRARPKGADPSPNGFWENESFRNYADYAMTPEFREGLAELRALGRDRVSAIMCAEAVWWRCHRRIIADYLLADGETVLHIMGPGKIEPARLTPVAVRRPDGTLVYPPPA